MQASLKNIYITIPFLIILIVMFVWLIRAFLSSIGKDVERGTDRLERVGYEPIRKTRCKEYSVIFLSVVLTVVCVSMMGFMSYWLFSSGTLLDDGGEMTMNLVMLFVPALVFLCLLVAASWRHLKRQQRVLDEYRKFRDYRDTTLGKYREKRRKSTLTKKG